YGLRPLLPPGTITFPRYGTAIDLVWGNEATQDVLLKCQVAADNDHGSDHYPIEIVLDLAPRLYTPSQMPYNQGWTTSVRSRFGSVQCAGPTILEMESDRTDSRMNLDRTEPRPIQKQRRPTDRSGPWMTIGPDRTDAHINLGRDMRYSLRLSLKRHKQSSVMLHTQNEVKFEDYTDDVA